MATTIDTINAKVTEAVEANEAGDFETALAKLRSAKMLIATIPSRSAKEGQELEFDANAIDSIITNIERARIGSLGIRVTKIEFERPTSDEE